MRTEQIVAFESESATELCVFLERRRLYVVVRVPLDVGSVLVIARVGDADLSQRKLGRRSMCAMIDISGDVVWRWCSCGAYFIKET